MCSILFSTVPQVGVEPFSRALSLMNHRGPDAKDTVDLGEGVLLGHCRLKVVDLDKRSNQPFWDSHGRYVISFNGEIYNFRDLAKKHSLCLRTTSDTEVIVELYKKLGPSCVNELDGQFAFVVVDTPTRQFFVARDRLGVKPLYMAECRGGVLLSSEVRPLLELLGSSEIDPIGLRQYRKLRSFFNGRTLYRGVQMFPAGHFLQDGKISPYWTLNFDPKPQPDDEELFDLVNQAVQKRMIADVNVGTFVSGGLDSSIVTALSKASSGWSVGSTFNNEFEFARDLCEKVGTEYHEVTYQEDTFLQEAQKMVLDRLEPLSVPNEVCLKTLSKATKTKCTVVLTGEGADELFYGYDRIFRWAEAHEWDLVEFTKHYAYGTHEDIEIVEDALGPFLKEKEPLRIVSAFFQRAHLHTLLRRLDASTMACGLEARAPFTDYRLIERVTGTPFAYRMQEGVVKAPLKRIFGDLLPPRVLNRTKVGFPVALDRIFVDLPSSIRPMDAWLNFNLTTLGIRAEERMQ